MQPYAAPSPVQITAAEFFVTNGAGTLPDDPGVGNATPIAIIPGMTVNETLVIPVECWDPSLATDRWWRSWLRAPTCRAPTEREGGRVQHR